jgi:Rod binding domain-containing protein
MIKFTNEIDKVPNINKDKESVAKELNGYFISHFLKLMYETVDINKDDAFGGSSGEKIFREFLLNEYGKTMSDKFQLTNDMMSRYFNQNSSRPNVDSKV